MSRCLRMATARGHRMPCAFTPKRWIQWGNGGAFDTKSERGARSATARPAKRPPIGAMSEANWRAIAKMAEREGFEPPIPLRVCRISSAVLSTTQPPLREAPVGRRSARPLVAARVLSEDVCGHKIIADERRNSMRNRRLFRPARARPVIGQAARAFDPTRSRPRPAIGAMALPPPQMLHLHDVLALGGLTPKHSRL